MIFIYLIPSHFKLKNAGGESKYLPTGELILQPVSIKYKLKSAMRRKD